jgi:hypothetical protein
VRRGWKMVIVRRMTVVSPVGSRCQLMLVGRSCQASARLALSVPPHHSPRCRHMPPAACALHACRRQQQRQQRVRHG